MDKIEIGAASCIYGAVLCLILPLRWLGAALLAAAFHELCHYAAVRLCGGTLLHMEIGIFGAEMEVSPLTPWQEILCAAAGPAGSFLLAAAGKWMPVAAVCALAQGCFNLLPLYPMDGGRIIRGVLTAVFPHRGQCISEWVEWGTLSALLLFSIYGWAVLKLSFLPLLMVYFVLYRGIERKILAKKRL